MKSCQQTKLFGKKYLWLQTKTLQWLRTAQTTVTSFSRQSKVQRTNSRWGIQKTRCRCRTNQGNWGQTHNLGAKISWMCKCTFKRWQRSGWQNGVISKGGGATSFPSFDGKDLDGNDIKSSDFFKSNNVTVVNYWFSTCKPCVGELPELEALNKKLAEKGGQVVGINTFTIDGDRTAISEAKDILSKKGVTYKNIWFDSNMWIAT